MSAADADAQRSYETVVVCGGGCYGAYYVRQLRRALAAGALAIDRILVVDRDAACRVATARGEESLAGLPGCEGALVTEDWRAFFARFLPGARDGDAIVPSPLMPHLMFEWLAERARERWPGRSVGTGALTAPPSLPWERAAPDGTHYVSHAAWTCPVNCVEPRRCPAIRADRTWTMPSSVQAIADVERGAGRPVVGSAVFHCTHRAYGVGMLDARDVVAADRLLAERCASAAGELLVATVSHCHGVVNRLVIGG